MWEGTDMPCDGRIRGTAPLPTSHGNGATGVDDHFLGANMMSPLNRADECFASVLTPNMRRSTVPSSKRSSSEKPSNTYVPLVAPPPRPGPRDDMPPFLPRTFVTLPSSVADPDTTTSPSGGFELLFVVK